VNLILSLLFIFGYSQSGFAGDGQTTESETSFGAFELVAPCGADIASILTEKTLDFAEKIAEACELQNQKMAPAFRCPFQTCQGEIVKGGYAAPIMEVRVGNTSTPGMGSVLSYPSSSTSGGEKIFVATTLKFSLARDPDKVVCHGTLSPVITTPLFTKILAEVASSTVCKKK
jgi:hypothetical protein